MQMTSMAVSEVSEAFVTIATILDECCVLRTLTGNNSTLMIPNTPSKMLSEFLQLEQPVDFQILHKSEEQLESALLLRL